MKKTKILLTGATGNMGNAGLEQLYANKSKYQISLLALPTKKDKQKLDKYTNDASVSIIWGNLTNYNDVEKAVANVDIVLHVGALVSPVADHKPELAWDINYNGTKNIVDAILSRSDSDKVKMVYIGTVAQTGNRPAPYHWGRVGDPITASAYDYYALSKIAAERYVIESGLKNWVSLRQTGIMHKNLLEMNDGIAYHQPINNHIEWVTANDSGRLLANICSKNLPDVFWNNVYNIGGGKLCRLTSYQLYDKIYGMMGVDFRDFEEPNWYALRNFHGQYYYDSDKLENFLHFRSETVDDVIEQIRHNLPFKMRIIKYLPKKIVQHIMRKTALKGDTPLRWIKDNDEGKIKAFFESEEKWEEIKGWDSFEYINNPKHKKLKHGYDESKNDSELNFEDIQQAAQFRGGKCLSETMKQGDLKTKLRWECSHGHTFKASPYLILKTGHWCPKCLKTSWNQDNNQTNLFLSQIDMDSKIKEDKTQTKKIQALKSQEKHLVDTQTETCQVIGL